VDVQKQCRPFTKKHFQMSLNRYEQALFDYWEKQPDERRHWQAKIIELTRGAGPPGDAARVLERELWEYFVERSPHVPALRMLQAGGLRRVSLLNLAEQAVRRWGPPPKPKKPADRAG
jgi:hypothetical protein